MGATKAVGPAAAAYAAALRAAVDGYLSLGGTQKELAVASHVAPATLSRYLSGERIAPAGGFVASLATFLAEHGQPLDEGVRARLAELCGRAHEASGSPAVQLVHLKEELAHVREKKGAREAELAALQRHADQLAAELRQALERARRSEKERLALEGRVADQEKSRQHAQTYTRRLQSELTALHEQVLLVQGEVEVLRRQNQRLVEEGTEIPGPRVEAPVSGVSTQVSGMRGESSLSSGSADRDGKRKEGHRKEPKKPKPGSRRASESRAGGQDAADQRLPVFDTSWTGNEDQNISKNQNVGVGVLLIAVACIAFYTAMYGSAKDNPALVYAVGGIFLLWGGDRGRRHASAQRGKKTHARAHSAPRQHRSHHP
ncbi:helix-turn-helix domain-containing protein [Streptomyces sp. PDY-4]|uniref:helix-turn-helix domain-containing protein n=1 Tax=Streptomyces sp. PDY-4 TaxID=3376070 RepID=UPI0037B4032C